MLNTKAKENRSLLDHLEKFSDWSRAVQAVARLKQRVYIHTGAKEHMGVKKTTHESTTLEERNEAELAINKVVPKEAFPNKIKS